VDLLFTFLVVLLLFLDEKEEDGVSRVEDFRLRLLAEEGGDGATSFILRLGLVVTMLMKKRRKTGIDSTVNCPTEGYVYIV